MKCRFTVRKEKGIALVITLVMLAVVTLMAIVFLAVTRRERSSVKLAEETAIAKDMADAALERAKAEALAGMNTANSRLHYDLFNSQSFFNPNGFDPAQPPTNVNVAHIRDWPAIRQQGEKNYLELLGNLQHDPPVPVFVQTNANGRGDFRFFLDFNRNRQFETNGLLFDLDFDERPLVERVGTQTRTNVARFVGDPEWIGVLERPDLPHSETNRFVGRMAYLVLPAGKTLDLNFIHNQVNGPAQLSLGTSTTPYGFGRSQGVGSWEINLAAYLRELNTNNYGWGFPASYRYTVQPNQRAVGTGETFDHARKLLSFRYSQTSFLDSMYTNIAVKNLLNPLTLAQFNAFQRFNANNIEDFGDRPFIGSNGEIFFPPPQTPPDADDPTLPGWPGSYNTNAFTDLQQLFNLQHTSPSFQANLQDPARLNAATPQSGKSSYDRYTFYRLAASLGTDSTPALGFETREHGRLGKVHLNFKNPVGQITNSVIPWTDAISTNSSVEFFTKAADAMLKASIDEEITLTGTNLNLMRRYSRPPGTYYRIGDTLVRTNFSITNIQMEASNLYPNYFPFMTQNEYTPTVHRILQVAANIWDNMSDKGVRATGPFWPTVFAPEFTKVITPTNTSIIISGFREVTNTLALASTTRWRDMSYALTNNEVQPGQLVGGNFFNLYGQHYVIGAKKGHPNFNELAMQANIEVARKLAMTKQSLTSTNIASTNQMFVVNMKARWGMEAWNSYITNYTDVRTIFGEVISHVTLRDGTDFSINNPPVFQQSFTNSRFFGPLPQWPGAPNLQALTNGNMQIVFDVTTPLIPALGMPERSYSTNGNRIGTNRFSNPNLPATFATTLEGTPQFVLYTTNMVRFWMINNNDRVIDFVSFDKLTTVMNMGPEMFKGSNPQSGSSLVSGSPVNENMFWNTNGVGGVNSGFTIGHSNQLAASSGDLEIGQLWRDYNYQIGDKERMIGGWRHFLGLDPMPQYPIPENQPPELTRQAPFAPSKNVTWTFSWQANDPLVHYIPQDMRRFEADETLTVRSSTQTNWNIGAFNRSAFLPWGGSPQRQQQTGPQQGDEFIYQIGLQDPGVRRSDDWDFPITRRSPTSTNYFFPNIGTLGQVHRGTPWQTLYLKSIYRRNPGAVDPVDGGARRETFVDPSQWVRWAGSRGTYPSRDWRLLDVFTTAANENAARGLLSVNQTNTAAWAAVLGGVVVAKSENVDFAGVSSLRGVPPDQAFTYAVIDPGSPELNTIVRSINDARTNQYVTIDNPVTGVRTQPYTNVLRLNPFNAPYSVFDHMGDILSAPALSVQNPYLLRDTNHVQKAWTDRAVEYIPQQILSLLRQDEPRFVVYAFGQSLKPAPRSLTSDPDFYHMCTNYQIMGEVITKTTLRVEGDAFEFRKTAEQNAENPLRAVVEKYEILPPPE